jgi:aspartate racemase
MRLEPFIMLSREKGSQGIEENLMKRIGVIGGIGPESTIEYYRAILGIYAEQKHDGHFPSIIINSIDLKKLLDLLAVNQLAQVTEYLVAEIQRLARAGAECAAVAANTPHIVFDDIQRQSPIPLVSIVQATCAVAKALALSKIGLFGTRYTMQGRFYPDVFTKAGIALAVPDDEAQAFIHNIYFSELVKGIILPATRERLLTIVDAMKERDGIQGLILGGTELSLILRDASVRGIPVLDTTRIHARAIVAEVLS